MIMIEVEEFGGYTEVRVKIEKWETRISIYSPRREFGQVCPAKVNWPCTGSQTVENTAAFIKGLEKANEIAKDLNSKFFL